MASRRQIQISEIMAHQAADFFVRESSGQSLLTVTRADVSPDLKNVIIYFSVLPTRFEESALAFAKRHRSNFRDYIKAHSRLRYLPTINFDIDYGEKNRQ